MATGSPKRHRNDISNVPVAGMLKLNKGSSPGMSVVVRLLVREVGAIRLGRRRASPGRVRPRRNGSP
jgi:hypothetical protein